MRRHKHDWSLIDKTVVPPSGTEGKMKWGEFEGSSSQVQRVLRERNQLMQRMVQGYVVLTFKCDCGEIRIEER